MKQKIRAKEKFSFIRAAGITVKDQPDILQPVSMLHIDCRGFVRIENCVGIDQYDMQHMSVNMKNCMVKIEGDSLTVDSYRKSVITLHGRIFSVQFCGKEN